MSRFFLVILMVVEILYCKMFCQPQIIALQQPLNDIHFQQVLNNVGKQFGIPGMVVYIKSPAGERTFVYNHPPVAGFSFVPVTASNYFRIGSITKNFVATMLLIEVEQGDIQLDDPITPYVNLPGINTNAISIRHLLCHKSGLGDFVQMVISGQQGHFFVYPNHRFTGPELLSLAVNAENPPQHPGIICKYSSTNYLLAGKIVEKLTHTPNSTEGTPKLAQPLESLILQPNDIDEIKYLDVELGSPNLAHGYEKGQLQVIDVTEFDPSVTNSAGSIIATARGLGKYVDKLFSGQIITNSSLSVMTTNYGTDQTGTFNFGLGLFSRYDGHKNIYFHSGLVPGFLSFFEHFENKTIVIFINTSTDPNAKSAQSQIISILENTDW